MIRKVGMHLKRMVRRRYGYGSVEDRYRKKIKLNVNLLTVMWSDTYDKRAKEGMYDFLNTT